MMICGPSVAFDSRSFPYRRVPVEETPDVVPAKKRGRPKPRVPVKKAPAKKAASKKDSKKKNADSDEDDYVPEKEEPDEAFDIKLEEEADDVNPAEDEEDGEDGDAGDLYRVKKRGKRANVSKSRKKKEPKRSGRTIVRVDPVTLEHKRVLDTHVEADVGDPEFERQLVEFLETGMCPKCQSTLKRAHERHLKLYVLVGDAMDVRCFLTASLLLPYPARISSSAL